MEKTSLLPRVDQARCKSCGLCAAACPCHRIEIGEQGPIFHCPDQCDTHTSCSEARNCSCICEEVCPENAIECPFEIILGADQCEL